MRKLLYILLVLISTKSIGQPVISRGGAANTLKDERLMIGKNMFIPIYVDSIEANTNKGIDSSGAMYYDRSIKTIMYRQHSPKKWVSLYPIPPLRFTNDVVVNGGAGTKVGVWSEGETIPLKGKLFDSLPYILSTKCLHPNYVTPTTSISTNAPFGQYEYGYNLGSITLSSTFTQNNGGTLSGTTYYQNGSALGGNTTSISSLTSNQSFYVKKNYNQGDCIVNNCGEIDCTGRIEAGSVNSSTGTYSIGYRRYIGWISDTTGIATGGQNSAILANVINSSFSTSQIFGSNGSPISTGNPTDTQFWVFAYLSSGSDMSAITMNGLPSIDGFNKVTITNFTNNQGANVSLKVYYTINGQTTASSIYTQ